MFNPFFSKDIFKAGAFMKTDTIAAIATAMNNSGIGIVRISGEDACSVIDRIYRPRAGRKKLSQVKSHTVHYGYIYDEDILIDEVMVLIMRGPNSYTREDTVEIDCHGGTLVVRRILETVLRYGARAAEPGEFTKRAFLNGRIDLSQAESVIDVIQAKNDFALSSSLSQLKGAVLERIQKLRAKVLHEIAFIESALDDPEHISLEGYKETLSSVLEELLTELSGIRKTSENGALLKEGIQTVIVGKPNAGKSSLLNRLVGRERAIVTPVAGTTRDTLEEQISLGGITLNVVDTAGIRSTEDLVEQIGVDKAREFVDKGDLILYVVDASLPLDENDRQIMELLKDKKAIVLLNKTDLPPVITPEDLKGGCSWFDTYPLVEISALEGMGMEELEEKIRDLFLLGEISFDDEIYLTNARQKAALEDAYQSLLHVKDSMEAGMPEDFYSIDLMDAYEELGSIIGETTGEDLINEIFSKFCMGK